MKKDKPIKKPLVESKLYSASRDLDMDNPPGGERSNISGDEAKIKTAAWNTFCFTIAWDDESQPRKSWIDIFLINTIVHKIVERYQGHLIAWRIHRRASLWNKKDTYSAVINPTLPEPEWYIESRYTKDVGQQLKLFAYCTTEIAKKIDKQIQLYVNGLNAELFQLISYAWWEKDTKVNLKQSIAYTSDGSWDKILQLAWPVYAQGFSSMFLFLVKATVRSKATPTHTYDDIPFSMCPLEIMEEFYKSVETYINAIWYLQGSHAFLHHMNALFDGREFILHTKGERPYETRV